MGGEGWGEDKAGWEQCLVRGRRCWGMWRVEMMGRGWGRQGHGGRREGWTEVWQKRLRQEV